MLDMQRFGQMLAAKRRSQGLTQEQLADKLYVTHQAVSKWERGETLPEVTKLMELAGILSISVDQILSPETIDSALAEEKQQAERYVAAADAVSSTADEQFQKAGDQLSFFEILTLAPELSQESLLEAARRFLPVNGLFGVRSLFPYLKQTSADELAIGCFGSADFDGLKLLIPYMSEPVVATLMQKRWQKDRGLKGILPIFDKLSKQLKEQLITECYLIYGMRGVLPVASWIEQKDLFTMAMSTMELDGNWGQIDPLLRYLTEDQVLELAMKFYHATELSAFNGRWELLGRRNTALLIEDYIRANDYKPETYDWCGYILPYCDSDILRRILEETERRYGAASVEDVRQRMPRNGRFW